MRLAVPAIAGLAALALSLPAIAQPAGFILPDDAKPLTPHVYVVYAFPNVAIVVGSQATLVVDTGLGPKNGATVAKPWIGSRPRWARREIWRFRASQSSLAALFFRHGGWIDQLSGKCRSI